MSARRIHLGWFPHVDALLQRLRPPQTAARIARTYFREHPSLGRRDREAIMDLACDLLRDAPARHLLADHLNNNDGSLALAHHLLQHPEDTDRLLGKWRNADAVTRALRAAADAPPRTPPSIATIADAEDILAFWSLPRWWAEDLLAQGVDIESVCRGLRSRATLDLRVNRQKMDRASARTALGPEFEPTAWSQTCLRAPSGVAIDTHPLYLDGSVEIQDEGSQLIARIAIEAAKNPALIIDACAGGGGKALALAAAFPDAELHAWDISTDRFGDLHERARRAGAAIHTSVWKTSPPPESAALADVVLVDAPCSGSGTVRRSVTGLMDRPQVDALTRTQLEILTAACGWVKPDGILVYATCSILARENEDVVRAFLAQHSDFTLEQLSEDLPTVELDSGHALRLWPHLHGTDGFFAARMRRSVRP